jgi:hypothetical protein
VARRASRRLVIDASVMRAAGSREQTERRSANCREFLITLRRICHRVVLTPDIREEWDTHQSRFATEWRASMVKLRKVAVPTRGEHQAVRHRIGEACADPAIRSIVLKDALLIEAALAADRIVVSLDDRVRGHFARLTPQVSELGTIVWVNPVSSQEQPIAWLEGGARLDKRRRLDRYEPSEP